MRVGVLGSLVVDGREGAVIVPPAKQRALLAALALRAGQAVSFDELIEVAWDGAPPPNARVTVRNYVLRLRRSLGTDGPPVVTRDPGYLLDIGADEVDALKFERLCDEGGSLARSAAWPQAAETLRAALGLWRGDPLVDVPSQTLRDRWSGHLEQLQLRALRQRLRADLQLGKHEAVTVELGELTGTHPLDEELWTLQLLALYRSGRQGDALAAYREARQLLVTELGVDPGPDLRRLHQQILEHDPELAVPVAAGAAARSAGGGRAWPATVPRQLPAAVPGFAGRAAELKALDNVLDGAVRAPGTVVISAIGGTAGIGKTTLAVHFAHRAAPRFPDGQLYADLRGFHPSGVPLSASQVMRGFLDALGVPPDRLPADPDAQAALYRSLLADKRLLLLLDNARDAAQVRPLVPASAGCLVLVTSRNRLASLAAADGARLISLDLLTEAEARDLLAARLGNEKVAAEPEAAAELTRLCARLPLALAVAAGRAAAQPGFPLAAVAAELRGERDSLDVLGADEGASDLRAVFSWSYRQLAPGAARVFRLLGVHPGPDITAAAAASLAGIEPAGARAALRELAAVGLVTGRAPGRYALHDLLRRYASELAGTADSADERRAAVRRSLDHYLHTAVGLTEPGWRTAGLELGPPAPGVTPEATTHADGLAWFEAEYPVLARLIEQAAANGLDSHAWRLPWTLAGFMDRCGYWHDWAAAAHTALSAACRLGDRAGLARARHTLGQAYVRLGRYPDAREQLQAAQDSYAERGEPELAANVKLSFCVAFEREQRFAEAIGSAKEALAALGPDSNPAAYAITLNDIGYCYARLGDYYQALTWCEQALARYRDLRMPGAEAYAWDSLGYAHHHLGHYDQAIDCYRRALRLHEGNRYDVGRVLYQLGDVHQSAGEPAAARAAWREALVILDDLRHPDADQVRNRLEAS